jgi:DNA-binding response OmpR family regulator
MKRILIIEDDANIAAALRIRINSEGYETALASDALSALIAASKLHPDLILVDINIPAGNGFSVVERIRAIVPEPIPVIFITASKEPGLCQRAIDMGASGFIEKPYDPAFLLMLLRNVLQKQTAQSFASPLTQRSGTLHRP